MLFAVVVAHAGKSRLAGVLSERQRDDLVVAMARDVLAVCLHSPLVDGVIVVADALVAAHLAHADLVDDPGEMNAAVAAGIQHARARGADSVLVLPADIPLLTQHDLRALVQASHAPRATVIGASRDGDGTNALLLRPPDAITPAFGPPSVERHRRLALDAHCDVHVLSDLGLALDIDTPDDLAALRTRSDLPRHTRALVEHFFAIS